MAASTAMSRAVDDGVSIADLPRAIFVAGLMRPDDDTGTTYRFRLTTFNIETAPAHIEGATLYADSLYPSIVIDGSDKVVQGYVVTCPDESFLEMLTFVDNIQGYDRTPHLYERTTRDAFLDGSGESVRCVVYHRPDCGREYEVPNGDWMQRDHAAVMVRAVQDYVGLGADRAVLETLVEKYLPGNYEVEAVHMIVNAYFAEIENSEYEPVSTPRPENGVSNEFFADQRSVALVQWQTIIDRITTEMVGLEGFFSEAMDGLRAEKRAATGGVQADLEAVEDRKEARIAEFDAEVARLREAMEADLATIDTEQAELQEQKAKIEAEIEGRMDELREERDRCGFTDAKRRLGKAKETYRKIEAGFMDPRLPAEQETADKMHLQWERLKDADSKLNKWHSTPDLHAGASQIEREITLFTRAAGADELQTPTRKDTTTDLRDLLDSGAGADVTLVVGSERFAAHKAILTARSAFFQVLLDFNVEAEVVITRREVGREAFLQLLRFIYMGRTKMQALSQAEWNELLDAAMALEWEEATENIFVRMEESLHEDESERVMQGDVSDRVAPGWTVGAAAAGTSSSAGTGGGAFDPRTDWADFLTFSFELEGKSLNILNLYRRAEIDDDAWAAMSLAERFAAIGNNFTQLTQKRDALAPDWMPSQIVYEDLGVLWEVYYGGKTVGYSVDWKHVFEELRAAAVDLGLAHCERFDHIQFHCSFPLFAGETPEVRKQVLALGIHISDFLFLRNTHNSFADALNDLWASADVAMLFAKSEASPEEFSEFVVRKANIPNDALKLKTLGFRGIDIYKKENRYGFEIRKGYTLQELELLIERMVAALASLGRDEAPRMVLHDLNVDSVAPLTNGALLSDLATWVGSSARYLPYLRDKNAHQTLEDTAEAPKPLLSDDLVDLVVAPWMAEVASIERFLAGNKQICFGQSPANATINEKFLVRASKQLRQRCAFVLCTDWTQFPSDNANLLGKLDEEQDFIRGLIEALADYGPDDPRTLHNAEIIRERIHEFAARLSLLY